MKLYSFCVLLLAANSAIAQKPATLDETARFLAGLPVEGPLQPLSQTEAWGNHAAALQTAWDRKEHFQLGPIRTWMTANANRYYNDSSTMYYMFSGPDFLYAHTFFPNARTYILAGLEPIGQVPDLTRVPSEELANQLGGLRGSMSTILQTHYFITKEMRTDLERAQLGGTLPILYVFLARTGCVVLDTTYISDPAPGVKINFQCKGQSQTLYYFKTDLSAGKSNFLRWCAGQGQGLSLLKAASYLLHGEGFGGVRKFVLDHSKVIVQDDSGIPLRGFPKGWTVNCYGRYVPHKEMFDKFFQPDLNALYQKDPPPTPLGFSFGYHWQIERGILMVATPHEH